ncbi:MAG: DUF5011 domain-containing protein [Candidatus Zambryskibacteria bacterium]|nr:DUF5011 domain-containing protein [Candidatus Zambryskibacteria bacterium]
MQNQNIFTFFGKTIAIGIFALALTALPQMVQASSTEGSVRVCVALQNSFTGGILSESLPTTAKGQFSISLATTKDFSSPVLSTNFDATLFASNTTIDGISVKCTSYASVPFGSYYYNNAILTGSTTWSPLRYFDAAETFSVGGAYTYSGVLFNLDPQDDVLANNASDGVIVVSETQPERTVVVLASYDTSKTAFNSNLISPFAQPSVSSIANAGSAFNPNLINPLNPIINPNLVTGVTTTTTATTTTGGFNQSLLNPFLTRNIQGEVSQCVPGVNIVSNGGFEYPVITLAKKWDIIPFSTLNLGWLSRDQSGYGLEIQAGLFDGTNTWLAQEGTQYAEIDGGKTHEIAQTLSTVAGKTYTLTFWTSPRPHLDSSINRMNLFINDVLVDMVVASGTPVNTWSKHTYTFVADSSTTRVSFVDAKEVSTGTALYLDNVSVTCDGVVRNMCVLPSTLGDTTKVTVENRNLEVNTLQKMLDTYGLGLNQVQSQKNYQTFGLSQASTTLEVTYVDTGAGAPLVFGYHTSGNAASFVPVFKTGTYAGFENVPVLTKGQKISVNVLDKSSISFGIKSGDVNSPFFSTETSLNADGVRHALVYDVSTSTSAEHLYAIAFEDLTGLGDHDYNDVVVTVGFAQCSVKDVPPVVTPANTAPKITLVGANPLSLVTGTLFTDPGATATDLEDGNITNKIVVTGTVATTTPGTYTLTYTVTDLGGLTASTTRQVVVTQAFIPPSSMCVLPDTLGDTTIETTGASFGSETGLLAVLAQSGISVASSTQYQTWHTNKASTTITLELVNGITGAGDVFGYYMKGKPSTFIPLFAVGSTVNTVYPNIPRATLGQKISVSVPAGDIGFAIHSTYNSVYNFWASENSQNALGEDHMVSYNVVSTSTPNYGTYVLAFEDLPFASSDKDYNDVVVKITVASCENGVVVPVNTPPTITLVGANPAQVTTGQAWVEPGATATDLEDGNITNKIVITGTVNVSIPGTYTLTYTVTDSGGLTASTTRQVIVSNPNGGGATTGSITFCSLYSNLENVLATSAAGLPEGSFVMKLGTTTNINGSTIQTKTWTATGFAPNKKVISSVNDADCVTYTDLAFGTYYYSELGVTGSGWTVSSTSPKYNDQLTAPVNNIFDMFAYSPELFNATSTDDVNRNVNSDGQIVLSSDRREHTVVMATKYTPVPVVPPVVTPPGGGGCVANCGGGGGNGPIVSSLAITNEKVVEITPGVALVTWTTNLPATKEVGYGNTSQPASFIVAPFGYATSTVRVSSPLETIHSYTIAIESGKTYYFRPVSTDFKTTVAGIELVLNPGTGGIGGGGGEISNPNTCYYLFDYLKQGWSNNPVEVKKLQVFLKNLEGYDVVATGIYDDQTVVALNAFQNRYKADILTPWGHTAPTSFTYITTKKKVNEIYCKMAFPVTVQQQAEIDAYRAFLQGLSDAGVTVGTPTEAQINQPVIIDTTDVGILPPVPTSPQVTLAGENSTTTFAGRLTANVLNSGKRLGSMFAGLFTWPSDWIRNMFGDKDVNECTDKSIFSNWFNWILLIIIFTMAYLWYRERRENKKALALNKELDLMNK